MEKAPVEFLEQFKRYHPIAAQLLYNRGMKNESQAVDFLNPEYGKLHDPFLFKDMEKAVERILQAIQKKEKIIVHGDYDADGVTSAAVLFKILKNLNADVEVFIPHREWDGYGLNMENCQNFVDQGFKLLITVDCGITNVEEIDFLNKFKVDTIITDHHEPAFVDKSVKITAGRPLEILPKAFALLDPKTSDSGYPFRDLAGAGIAFKLAQAILQKSKIQNSKFKIQNFNHELYDGWEKWILDIVAIGTVADVAPIIDENRILVKWGLVVLQKTRNLGLKKLLESIGNKKTDVFTIGFQIAPRLNAAGRMNHANVAFKLLITEDAAEAQSLADDLQKNNSDRQRVTEIAVSQAKELFAALGENRKILFAFHENWEPGIIGLIAGKLCDEFYKPAVAMTVSRGHIIGSGRSVPEFNITHGLVLASKFLLRFGGHCQACGFTLGERDFLEDFQNELLKHAELALSDFELKPTLPIDVETDLRSITWDLLNQLEMFTPYGEGNQRPRILFRGLQIAAKDCLGSDGQHLRLLVKQNAPIVYKMIGFGLAKKNGFTAGDLIDAVCEIGVNEWNGNKEIEFKIVDLRYSNHE